MSVSIRQDETDGGAMPRVAAVMLAAGMSRRMGTAKALLPFDEEPLIARAIDCIASLERINPIIVVTGHERDRIEIALDRRRVKFVHNSDYAAGGMLSSVKVGVAAVANDCEAFFLALADQPLVSPQTLREIITSWRQTR